MARTPIQFLRAQGSFRHVEVEKQRTGHEEWSTLTIVTHSSEALLPSRACAAVHSTRVRAGEDVLTSSGTNVMQAGHQICAFDCALCGGINACAGLSASH